MHQQSLFAEPKSIDAAFEEFHNANPQVYQAILWLCRRRVAAGHKHWSMAAIFERLRYAAEMNTTGSEVPNVGKVKLNDQHTALYARLVMDNEPSLRGFFETRKRPSTS